MVVIYTVGPGTFPSISPQTFNPLVLTQQPNGFGIDQLVTTVDGTNGIFATNMTSAGTWQITSGDPSGFFNNATLSNYLLFIQPDGSAHLRTGAVAPPVGTATMNIRATNAIGPGYSGTSTISVTVPQTAPVVSNQSYLLPQIVVAGPLVPNMSATNTPTAWTITNGDPSGTQNTAGTSYFLMNNSGQLSVTSQGAAALNPSFNPINLTVQATNAGGNGSGTATVNVQSGAVPVVTPETFGLVIPTTGNSLIGFVIPATNSPTGWSITGGNSSGFYAINNAGQLSIASSYSGGIQPGSYPLTVVASNASGPSIGATVTVIANVYVDGFAGARPGTIPQPSMLTSYGANRPPWKVAGVDYPVGQMSGITVIGTTAANPTQTQITNSGAATGITIAGSTVTMSGPNPTLGSTTVGFTFATGTVINVSTAATGTATIQNVVITGNATGNAGIQINAGNGAAANLTILNSEVNGQKVSNSATTPNDSAIYYGGNGTTTVRYCYLHGLSCDAIQIQQGTGQTYDIRWNLVYGFGYSPAGVSGGHPDTLQMLNNTLNSGVFAFNSAVQPVDGTAGQGGDNEVLANIADSTGSPAGLINNTIHANNVVISAGTSGQTSSLTYGSFVENTNCRINKHQVVFNYWDPSGSGFAAWYGQNNANWQNVTTGTLGVYLGNRLLTTGALSNPTSIGYVPAGSTSGVAAAPTTTDVAVASGSPVVSSPATGTVIVNQSITFTVTATRALTIQGFPQLNLSNGAKATYTTGTGTTSIQFVYTVGASDTNATNLAITGTTIPAGALIIDLFGNTANMSGAQVTFSGLNVSVSGSAPSITNSGTSFTIQQPLAVGRQVGTMTATNSPNQWTITNVSQGALSDWNIANATGLITLNNAGLSTGNTTITMTATNGFGTSNPGQCVVTVIAAGVSAFPGQAGNLVGYNNTPSAQPVRWTLGTWPGAYASLTAATLSSQTSGTVGTPNVVSFKDFDGGSSQMFLSQNNIIFVGCRFQSNSLVDGYNVQMAQTCTNVSFFYCSFTPRAAVVAAPPGARWPSAGVNTITMTPGVNCIAVSQAFQYGLSFGHAANGMDQGTGPILVDHCDFWGHGQCGPQSFPQNYSGLGPLITISDCWIHDNADGSGFHSDGYGYQQGLKAPTNCFVDHCTVASLGNSDGIAFQGTTSPYNTISVTNSFICGYGYSFLIADDQGTDANLTVTGNTFGTHVQCVFGPIYGNPTTTYQTSKNNIWRNNKVSFLSGSTQSGSSAWSVSAANNGQYIWPNWNMSNTDYSG